MTARSLAFVAVAALVLAGGARAYERPTKLSDVAAVHSLGVGEVRCPSAPEWGDDFFPQYRDRACRLPLWTPPE
jgi:hypothetical protein